MNTLFQINIKFIKINLEFTHKDVYNNGHYWDKKNKSQSLKIKKNGSRSWINGIPKFLG